MTKLNIKKGDNVVVIAGKEKGKSGKVLTTIDTSNRVLVEDINIVTKHQKPRSQKDKGGLIKKPNPIEISNVMVVCPTCGKATRVARKEIDGKNVRICKKCGASLDKAFTKAKKEAKKPVEVKKEEKPVKETKKQVEEKATTEKKVVAKKPATKAKTTEKVAVKKSTAKASTSTARRSTNRGK